MSYRLPNSRKSNFATEPLRWVEPSNFWATSLRCQPRMVSGLTMVATSCKAFFPSFWPMSANVLRSLSVNRTDL